jgi:hypothetical protein
MTMYGGFRGAKIVKADIAASAPLASDPRYMNSRPGAVPTERLGDTRELAEAAERAIQVMNHKEGELRGAGVIVSDGRIIYEEEAYQMGRAVAEGRATIGPTDERGFEHQQGDPALCDAIGYRGDPRAAPRMAARGDPRAAHGAHARQMYEDARFATRPNHHQLAESRGRNAMPHYGAPQQPVAHQQVRESAVCYGDGADARVGDVIQNKKTQILSEVLGAAPGGLRVDLGEVGRVVVPFEELTDYSLMGRG